jgi:hypothetical protein
MLWRLLFMDHFAHRSPAPSAITPSLPHLIISMFFSHFDPNVELPESGAPPSDRDAMTAELDALERAIKEICRLEPVAIAFLPEMSSAKGSMAMFNLDGAYRISLETLCDRAAKVDLTSTLDQLLPPTSRNQTHWWDSCVGNCSL